MCEDQLHSHKVFVMIISHGGSLMGVLSLRGHLQKQEDPPRLGEGHSSPAQLRSQLQKQEDVPRSGGRGGADSGVTPWGPAQLHDWCRLVT